jgi:hypothetical protein
MHFMISMDIPRSNHRLKPRGWHTRGLTPGKPMTLMGIPVQAVKNFATGGRCISAANPTVGDQVNAEFTLESSGLPEHFHGEAWVNPHAQSV